MHDDGDYSGPLRAWFVGHCHRTSHTTIWPVKQM